MNLRSSVSLRPLLAAPSALTLFSGVFKMESIYHPRSYDYYFISWREFLILQ